MVDIMLPGVLSRAGAAGLPSGAWAVSAGTGHPSETESLLTFVFGVAG